MRTICRVLWACTIVNCGLAGRVVASAPPCLPAGTPVLLRGDPGMCMLLRLDESAGTRADASGKGNNLVAMNSPGRNADHHEGAFSLDLVASSREYLMRSSNNLSAGFPGNTGGSNTALTVAGWVKLKSAGNYPLVAKAIGAQRSWSIEIRDFGAGPRINPDIFSADGRGFSARGVTDFAGTTVLQVGQWYHFAYTYDAASGRSTLYVNGAVDAGPFDEHMGPYFTGTAPLLVGYRPFRSRGSVPSGVAPHNVRYRPLFQSQAAYADVLVDEIVVMDRALSAAEVGSLYQYGVLDTSPTVCAASCTGSCDDGDPCTQDACDPLQGCVHTPIVGCCTSNAQCDDGNACNGLETCDNSRCVAGTSLNCDDGNVCTDDICDPHTGCLHANNSAGCSTGNPCTSSDFCSGGLCIAGDVANGCSACQAATTIPAQGGTFVGTTHGSSTLTGTCGATGSAPERVYRWTPSASGTATLATCSSTTTFDTALYVRAGDCQNGAEVGCNADRTGCESASGPSDGSQLTLTVSAGGTYYIVIDGTNGSNGTYALTVTPPTVCGDNIREGTEQCDGTDVADCATKQCTASCTCVVPPGGLPDLQPEIPDWAIAFDTTVNAGDVAEGCAEATSGIDLLRFSMRTRNLGTADVVLGYPMCPSPCTAHPLAVCGNPEFICSPAQGHNHAHYTDYARYELLDATGQAVVVGHKQGFCFRDSGCANPKYTCSFQGLSAGCTDTYASNLGCQYLDITGLPAGKYTLRVTVDPFNRIAELSKANNVATLPITIPSKPPTTAVRAP